MKYKLICFDIDGTLLDDSKRLLPQVRQAVREAADMGIQIALASGRMPAGVMYIERQLGIPCIKICNAGTYAILGSECIYSRHMPPQVMLSVYHEFAQKNQVPLWIFREKEWFVTSMDCYSEREIDIVQHQPVIADAGQLAGQWEKEKTGPNKLLIAAAPEKIQDIYHQMKQRALPELDMACSSAEFIEIFPKGVTKAATLIQVCRSLDISLDDVIACGDQELDIPMIEAAGVGIAMGNAIEELKQKADFVTKSNNEAGTAYALAHYLRRS